MLYNVYCGRLVVLPKRKTPWSYYRRMPTMVGSDDVGRMQRSGFYCMKMSTIVGIKIISQIGC